MLGTIKFKMIVVVAVTFGLGGLAVTWRLHRVHEDDVRLLSRESIRSAAAAFGDVERTSTDLMVAALTAFLRDPAIAPAVAAGQREKLLALCAPTFEEYRAKYGLTNWNWWEKEPDGAAAPRGLRNIARVQSPGKFGDLVERTATQRIAAEKRLVTGLDLGFTGLALRALLPVAQDGAVVGYVEWGLELKTFLERMKRLSGNEYGLVVEKAAMNRAQWASTQRHLGDRDGWDDMRDLLLVQDTAQDPTIFQHDGTIADVPEGGKALDLRTKGGRTYARGVFPVTDMAGRKVGAVFVLRDITALQAEMSASRRHAIVTMLVLMVVLALVLLGVFQALVVRRLERMTKVATRVVGGAFDLEVVPAANDEIGAFETLFEQFRVLFVGLLEQTQREERPTDERARRGS
jgi:methyl-accepting chemotaxis protein